MLVRDTGGGVGSCACSSNGTAFVAVSASGCKVGRAKGLVTCNAIETEC